MPSVSRPRVTPVVPRATFPLVAFPRVALPLLLLAGCASSDGVRIAEQLFPGAVAGDRGPFVTRLVDDLTGAPVAGAELLLVRESQTPIGGEFWFSHRGVSDADGFVRIPRPKGDRDWHIQVVRHPAHGIVARSGHWNATWRLGAAFDVPVRVVDWLGVPAPGARVGWCGGCGHTPDLVNAIADANGIAVLRGIDPRQDIGDLYVHHPGLDHYYQSLEWRPGEPPDEVRCGPAPVQTGAVLDHRGQPVAGAFVESGGHHRGPWARTAADGTFAIVGASPGFAPHTVVTAGGRAIHFPPPGRFPVTFRLPDLADADAYQGTIDQPSRRDVPPALLPTRIVRVEVAGAPAGGVQAGAEFEGERGTANLDPDEVLVPRAGPFVLTLHRECAQTQRVVFADAAAVPDVLRVTWRAAPRVVGRAVDANGRPLAARVRVSRWSQGDGTDDAPWRDAGAEGTFVFEELRAGTHLLEIGDAAGGLPSRRCWVVVPPPGATRSDVGAAERGEVERGDAERGEVEIDLGAVVLGGPSPLRAIGADGAPVAGGLATLTRPGWQQAGEPLTWRLGADGSWLGPDLRAGDTVRVQRDVDAVLTLLRLDGAGPWTVVVPDARVELAIVDEQGQPLAATVLFADQERIAKDGALQLRGLPIGPLRLWISAPGCHSAIVDAHASAVPPLVRVALPFR